MSKVGIIFSHFLLSFFLISCSDEQIAQPPFIVPKHSYNQKSSVIQIPIQIDTQEIRDAILKEVPTPLSAGSTDKLTTDIVTTDPVSSDEVIESYKNINDDFFKPLDNTYKYFINNASKHIDDTFKVAAWIKHRVYLHDLRITFTGSQINIFTSYKIDIILDYEQGVLPADSAKKIKGLLKSTSEAEVELVGKITLDENAQLRVHAFKDQTKVKFTKIDLPSGVNLLELLKITNTEDFLTKKLLEEPVNKYVLKAIDTRMSQKSFDLNLAQRIQNLVQKHSSPIELSQNLWLVPKPSKLSLTQISTQNNQCSNALSVSIGVLANPELITSTTKPKIPVKNSIPIVCEDLHPKIYLYPNFNLKYSFVSEVIESEIKSLLHSHYSHMKHTIQNVRIYPSDTKLVVALDLIKKSNSKKVVTFYLWGTPKLNESKMNITLDKFDYTLETKNTLLKLASWVLDEKIRKLIKENAIFDYKKDYELLASSLSKIHYKEQGTIISGNINLLGIEDIYISKESLVIHARASGDLSYKINFQANNSSSID